MLELRPYHESDAQHIVSWTKDEYAFRQWCADRYDHFPARPRDINEFYDAAAESGSFFPFTVWEGDRAAGHLIMRFTDEEQGVIRFGFVIVDDSLRGKGYGKQMLLLAADHAFRSLNARKITLGVFRNNTAAYRCYESVGFREVDVAEPESYYVLGEVWECAEMELTR